MARSIVLAVTLLAHGAFASNFEQALVAAAIEWTRHEVIYNGAYFYVLENYLPE